MIDVFQGRWTRSQLRALIQYGWIAEEYGIIEIMSFGDSCKWFIVTPVRPRRR